MSQRHLFGIVPLLLLAMALAILGTGNFGRLDPDTIPSYAAQDRVPMQSPFHPDEYILTTYPLYMMARESLNPLFFEYPSGLMYLNYTVFRLTSDIDALDYELRQGESLRTYAPFSLYFIARQWTVLSFVIMVACAYGIGAVLVNRWAGFASALIITFSFVLVQHGHYAKPGMPASALMMLTTWALAMTLTRTNPNHRDRFFVLAGIFTGIATTTRYNAAAVSIVLCLVGLYLLWKYRNIPNTRKRATSTSETSFNPANLFAWVNPRMLAVVIIGWGMFPLFFLLGTPAIIFDFDNVYEQFTYISGQFLSTGANILPEYIASPANGFWLLLRHLFDFGIGYGATIALLFGVIAAVDSWRKRQHTLTIFYVSVLVFVTAYALVTMRTIRPYLSDNLLLLIIPQVAVLAGIGIGWLAKHNRWIGGAAMGIVLLIPIMRVPSIVTWYTQPDTRNQLQAWFFENVPTGSSVYLLDSYNLPLDETIYPHTIHFNLLTLDPDALEGFDYMVVSTTRQQRILTETALITDDEAQPWRDALEQINEDYPLIHVVERPYQPHFFSAPLMTINYWHQPTLRVYCLRPTVCQRHVP